MASVSKLCAHNSVGIKMAWDHCVGFFSRMRRGRNKLGLLCSAFILGILFYFIFVNSGPKIAWLTPNETVEALKPGALIKIRQAFLRFPRILSWYDHNFLKLVLLKSWIFDAPSNLDNQLHLAPPLLTDTNGLRIWIISPEQFTNWLNTLSMDTGITVLSRPRVLLTLGLTDTAIEYPSGSWASPMTLHPRKHFLDMMAKPVPQSRSITICASVTGGEESPTPSNGYLTKTNFFAGFRVKLDKGESLLVKMDLKMDDAKGTTWFILTPSVPAKF